MAQLLNRRKCTRLVLLFAAALGCSSAALSGTLAAFTYTAERAADQSAGLSA
jgi:hypothetical protein